MPPSAQLADQRRTVRGLRRGLGNRAAPHAPSAAERPASVTASGLRHPEFEDIYRPGRAARTLDTVGAEHQATCEQIIRRLYVSGLDPHDIKAETGMNVSEIRRILRASGFTGLR